MNLRYGSDPFSCDNYHQDIRLKKCDLLCANCHMELHEREDNIVRPVGIEPTTLPL